LEDRWRCGLSISSPAVAEGEEKKRKGSLRGKSLEEAYFPAFSSNVIKNKRKNKGYD